MQLSPSVSLQLATPDFSWTICFISVLAWSSQKQMHLSYQEHQNGQLQWTNTLNCAHYTLNIAYSKVLLLDSRSTAVNHMKTASVG